MSLDFSSLAPFVTPVGHYVVDFGGAPNGRPDPGETVDLITTLKNFGSDATAVHVELATDDPFITITDGSTDLGNLGEGETVENTADPFTIEIASNSPTGRVVMFSVNATFVGGETLSDLALCIGKFDYVVWDPTGDKSSGPIIQEALDRLGFTGTTRESLPLDRLDDFATLWVSFGIYAENFVLASEQPEGPAIVNFMAGGGCVYLEGGDVWAFDPGFGGFDFRPHFGVSAVDDGVGDLGHVLGVEGEFSEGMDFTYGGENSFVDHLNPTGDAFALFSNASPSYHCGIAADTGTYRSVAASFEFAGLEDGVQPSTRDTLALLIMDFFGIRSAGPVFADGFESGDTTRWSGSIW